MERFDSEPLKLSPALRDVLFFSAMRLLAYDSLLPAGTAIPAS